MPAIRTPVAKAISPDQHAWRNRIARNERGVMRAFLAWVHQVRTQIHDAQIAAAIAARATTAFDHVLQAVSFQPVTDTLKPITVDEAVREFRQTIRSIDAGLRLALDLHDPNFQTAVDEQGARLVREVTAETRRAINNVISRAYWTGVHPVEAAPQIKRLVGLTARQAQAVMNFEAAQAKQGVSRERAAARTDRYADRMLTRRAKTIARTETAKAQVAGRLASWDQAASHGLFDFATAEMEWSAVQTDPTEICAILDGTRVPLGSTWPGGLLPGDAHPNCRCAPVLILPPADDLAERLRTRIPEVNAQLGVAAAQVAME